MFLITSMALLRTRHFKTIYKNERIKIAGNNPTYTITWPDGRTMILEPFADGWYVPGNLEQQCADTDIADLGHLIDQRTKQV